MTKLKKHYQNCYECDEAFKTSAGQRYFQKKEGRNLYCSRDCYKKSMSKKQMGTRNTFFGKKHTKEFIERYRKSVTKTGKSVINGYVVINRPFGPGSKPIKEHRKIMQDYIGRDLEGHEHIHHINGDKADNDIKNLMIVSKSEHTRIHNQLRKKGASDETD